MNGYFCSIGENLANKIEDAPNPLFAGDYIVNKKIPDLTLNIKVPRTSGIQLPNFKLPRVLEMTIFLPIS